MILSINPSIKAFAVLVPGVLLGLTYDVFTPLLYFIFILAVTFTMTDIPILRWMKFFTPFLILALSFAWMTVLYANQTFSNGEVVFTLWNLEITTGSIQTGISLALRSLCFGALSLMFILTTDSTKLMLSFMQQCKLPPKITYGILAGYRFLPVFRHELEVLRQAHRIRGVSRARGIKGRVNQFRRYAIPLLANGIRKAERVSVAMESKGFTGDTDRTHYHKMTVGKRDWLFLGMMIGFLIAVFALSYYLGYLRIFGRKF
ncbi:energy-coupling factor transporter transmembrane component T family protein [Lentibacillus salicampi]|uniref:Energy-coupling factor transporter transmembrane protein EcfT n=1 Tax=Lentibacillus salicampi TaxID=175306 RepID=A0A4Y9ABT7_9BACI|nr:energy-coupling factor transporter transmembrane component T [Lentibacillus salicampi]TFJ92647.1 energy-coupling factor transporter transmembrane protein EcfT [Lentibacillus salicampi]